jgi:hypothetical protein
MGLFSPSIPAPPTPAALIAAAHELGHAVSAYAHGIGVTFIRTNLTRLDLPTDDRLWTPQQWHGWLVGCWAGYEAEVLWASRHGGRADKRDSGTDIRNFRADRHHIRLSESAARSAARAVVRRGWARIERHAPELAQRGHLTPW